MEVLKQKTHTQNNINTIKQIIKTAAAAAVAATNNNNHNSNKKAKKNG